ncbi:MAG TPA: alpha-hydroxy-acid oxidizing enzyme [Actinobacteria bacterium]|nr:alpha-hydroxy-acid oxidizing enzyme [Actinomycetota bacterium]
MRRASPEGDRSVRRQLPRPADLAPLMGFHRPTTDHVARRLAKAHSIADLRMIARRRTPRAVFDYTDGAAEQEISLRRARAAFASLEFRPSVLRDVGSLDPSVEVLGRRSAQPFGFAPTGFTRLMNHEGEEAVARAATRAGIPYALSTLGTTSIEDVARASGGGRLWFQLYVWRDRRAGEVLVRQAEAAGYEALILTVDTPVAGARMRDARNGLTIPPRLTFRTVGEMALHPAWWGNLLTTRRLEFASMAGSPTAVADMINALFDSTMTLADLEWLRTIWSGPLVVKGIQTVEDARRVVDAGADVVVVSNHGGRQLDRAPVPFRLLPHVVDEVGDEAEVWVDSGVLTGADVVACIAQGADLVLVGRAYLYGLMAGGERGVDRAATILADEVARTMRLLGVRATSELGRHHVAES